MITKTKMLLMSLVTIALVGSSLQFSAQTKRRVNRAPIVPKYTLGTNSVIRLRMNDSLSSKNASVGDRFKSTVVDPVYAKGFVVIPQGSIVTGQVTHVTRAGRKSQSGSLNVSFTSVQLPNGRVAPLNGSLTSSENTDNEGEVKGSSSKKRNIAFIGGGAVVGALINGAAGAGIGAGAGIAGALFSKGKEAEVKPGTEFNIILNRAVLLPEYKGGD
ncbi:MAG TPA: hypothetical protein VI306_18665 [Pyrinomonadaceae bacterium]